MPFVDVTTVTLFLRKQHKDLIQLRGWKSCR